MVEIILLQPEHCPAVKKIYVEGLATGNATFQTTAPEWPAWDMAHVKSCRIIALEKGVIIGWSALTPVSERCVYDGVAEVSVYVAEAARGAGVCDLLLKTLVKMSEEGKFWTLQAGIFPENKGSLKNSRARGISHRRHAGKNRTNERSLAGYRTA